MKKSQTSNTLVGSTKIRIVARVVEGVTNGWFGLGGQLVCKTNGARSIRAPPSLKNNLEVLHWSNLKCRFDPDIFHGVCSSVGRVEGCGSSGRGFDPHQTHQMPLWRSGQTRGPHKAISTGSNPVNGTI